VATKVAAARMAAWSGIPTVVAPGSGDGTVVRAVAGDAVGTWVDPRSSGLSARKLWIAFGVPASGRLSVDSGAARALLEEGRSLLPVGITAVDGSFAEGAAVEVVGPDGVLVAKGRTSLGSEEIRLAAGRHSAAAGGVVVHRDDLVVLREA
jgi:glutamate 5-kinase